MNAALKNQQIKKSQQRMVTTVTSVDGKPLEEVVPGLKNSFDSFSDAFNKIMKETGRRVNELKTKRVHAATYAIRG